LEKWTGAKYSQQASAEYAIVDVCLPKSRRSFVSQTSRIETGYKLTWVKTVLSRFLNGELLHYFGVKIAQNIEIATTLLMLY
jgi:hypothetical protein